jgi:hypothetical protein
MLTKPPVLFRRRPSIPALAVLDTASTAQKMATSGPAFLLLDEELHARLQGRCS